MIIVNAPLAKRRLVLRRLARDGAAAGPTPARRLFAFTQHAVCRAMAALGLAVTIAAPAPAAIEPQRTRDLVTLYATPDLSVSCSLPGEASDRTLAVDFKVDAEGDLSSGVVPAGYTMILLSAEVRVLTDAGRDVSVAIYSSQPGGPHSGHPLGTLTGRASDEGGNIGVAVLSGSWNPGFSIAGGRRPCIAEITGLPIHKDPAATGVHPFAYVLLHGFLTRR